jgi:hypothetical protein
LFWWATITGGISVRSGTWQQSSSTTRRTSSTWKTRKYRWREVHSCGTHVAIWSARNNFKSCLARWNHFATTDKN